MRGEADPARYNTACGPPVTVLSFRPRSRHRPGLLVHAGAPRAPSPAPGCAAEPGLAGVSCGCPTPAGQGARERLSRRFQRPRKSQREHQGPSGPGEAVPARACQMPRLLLAPQDPARACRLLTLLGPRWRCVGQGGEATILPLSPLRLTRWCYRLSRVTSLSLSDSQSSLSFLPGGLAEWREAQRPGWAWDRAGGCGDTGGSSPDKGVGICPKAATSVHCLLLDSWSCWHVRPQTAPDKGCGQSSRANSNVEKPAGPRRNQTSPGALQPAHDPSLSTQPSSLERQKSCPTGWGAP